MVTSFGSTIFQSDRSAAAAERCALALLTTQEVEQHNVLAALAKYGICTRALCTAVAQSFGTIRIPQGVDTSTRGKLIVVLGEIGKEMIV